MASDSLNFFIVPVKIVSEANNRDHWRTKWARGKRLKKYTQIYWNNTFKDKIKLPVEIKLVRIAPRSLDYDNLVISFKSVVDCIADIIVPGMAMGQADSTPGLKFSYAQEKAKQYGFRVEVHQASKDSK